ncbi:hypothetical protein RVR_9882 [Actinacidiphila reveromycinica]|uniref:3-keto-5-aminohexanoate cleavage protein n=1 Tax=Actinacidiphila reveromycinica TaxID=659352 RepID=A0A7U3V0C8_9ACTN|nr:3-keto-5-aminohexanoate cleavage protein [Streptomyces sp. SN-593]BBB02144.1 hypothetical protein RVR_9882 [Streptomyces sp. SN-593]
MLQVCLNGGRDRSVCEAVPVAAWELGDAAAASVLAGARSIHLHPRDGKGAETMAAVSVDAAVAAVRASAPGVPVGVTTGAWTEPDPQRRAALVRSWSVLPDHASVNWHEEGAEIVADALLSVGIGVEAGVFSGTDGAARLREWPQVGRVVRVLAEVVDRDPATAVDSGVALLEELAAAGGLDRVGRGAVLLHGEEGGAWPVLRLAARRGLDVRIGLEDTVVLPDGGAAADNAELVRAGIAEVAAVRG